MEFSREEQRAIIKLFCAKRENCVNIHRELVSVCGDSALDYSNVNRWMAKLTVDMSYTRVLHIKVAYRIPHK
jgi:hypothetical protein